VGFEPSVGVHLRELREARQLAARRVGDHSEEVEPGGGT
jgi:hypothetical protein